MIKYKRFITVFSFLLLLLGSTNYYIVNSKSSTAINKQHKSIVIKAVPFKYFFRGFVSLKYSQVNSYPHQSYIIENDKDWHDFMDKYVRGIPYFVSVDYSKECLLFSVSFSAKPNYAVERNIKKIIFRENTLVEECFDDNRIDGISHEPYALNVDGIENCYVNIVKISKKYIPKNAKNIYHAGEVFKTKLVILKTI